MANTYTNLDDLFTAIANAIRTQNNSSASIVPDTFPEKIKSLKTGFGYNNQKVTEIPDRAFYGCEYLNSVNCYNLTNIGASAFENCSNMKAIIIWNSVFNIDENAFKGCSGLTIYCEAESKPNGWNDNWNPDNCEVIWGFAPVETWDISATEDDHVVAKLYNDIYNIGMYSLIINGNGDMKDYNFSERPWHNYRTNINNVILLDGVTNIGYAAFRHCSSLTSITIPDSVTSIGEYAFFGCTSLISITIPDSVTNIDHSAFYNTAYYNNPSNWENDVLYIDNHLIEARDTLSGSYEIKDGVTNIGYGAFSHCSSLTFITIPDSVTSIGEDAFKACSSLTSITIPDGVTSISYCAFSGCSSLTSITIPDSVTSIGYYAFEGCSSLTSITIPDGVTGISNYAFQNCSSLTSINIPNSVTSIGYYAFKACSSLTSITIPDSVTSIKYDAFNGCSSLTSITYTGTIDQWNIITFGSDWNYKTPDYIIHCTDGDIAKDGTILGGDN